MPISIVIEDGSGIEGANSYVSVAYAKSFASNRGVNLGSNDEVAAQLITAMDFIETMEDQFQGERVYPETAFPRQGVVVANMLLNSTIVPSSVISTQCHLVIAQAKGMNILPNLDQQNAVIEEVVGPIRIKYADPSSFGLLPKLTVVEALMRPLLRYADATFSIMTVRV